MVNIDIQSKLRSKLRWGVFGILALLLISGAYVAPQFVNRGIDAINRAGIGIPHVPESEFSLGLDLQGGAHLVYLADVSKITPADRAEAVEGVRDVIERRVNGLGVGEPNIQTTRVGEEYRVIVELPGITDVNAAIAMIGGTPILEFREQSTEPPRELTEEELAELEEFNINAKLEAENLLSRIEKEEITFEEGVEEYSEDPGSRNNAGYLGFVGPNYFVPEIYDWASNAAEGDIDLVESDIGYFILKRAGTRDGEAGAEVRHILICYLGANQCDTPIYTKKEAEAKAQEVFNEANAENFADLVALYSSDQASKVQGGSIGVIGRGDTAQTFEEAVYAANAGEIVGPVETQFGYHVIYKVADVVPTEYEASSILIGTKTETDILPPADPFKPTGLSGAQLERAEVVTDPQTGAVQVLIHFDSEGTALFRELTEKHVGQPIAIYLDGEPISTPIVQQVITSGEATIQGGFTLNEARLLTQRLNAGALPVPVDIISQQTIGASLGAVSLEKSLYAGLVSLLVVMIFMVLYYRMPGILSVIALALYLFITLTIFKIIGVTLTLAGIAGLVLSIGMAVDANILIFERLREELNDGKSLRAGIEEGFLRAWTSIRDGNISTLITCLLLNWFGSSFVQGFAITLAIGVLVSMFSAIVVTRILLRFVAPWFKGDGGWMFLGRKKLVVESK